MTPEDLYRVKWVSDANISPDGKNVAFVVSEMDAETTTIDWPSGR